MNKVLKLSWAGVLSLSLASVLFSCQKDASEPLLTSAAKPGTGTAESSTPAFDLSLPDADVTCASSTTYCFNTALLNRGDQVVGGGKTTISATIVNSLNEVLFTSAVLNANQGAVCFSDLVLAAGTYNVVVTYEHVPNENANPQHASFSFPLTVKATEECAVTTCQQTGLLFTRTPIVVLDQALKPIAVNVTYTVTNCTEDQTFTNLKIQGGLVNKAGTPNLSSSGTGLIRSFDAKKNGGNYILTGYFDLAPTQYAAFNVKYSVGTGCGNPLTGEWSVKNGPVPVISTDLATTNPYYVNRLQSVCP
jgi:hypothetical protein